MALCNINNFKIIVLLDRTQTKNMYYTCDSCLTSCKSLLLRSNMNKVYDAAWLIKRIQKH